MCSICSCSVSSLDKCMGVWKCWDCDQYGPVRQNIVCCTRWRCTFPIRSSCQAGLGMSVWIPELFLTLALTLIHFRVWQRQLRHFTGCNVDRAQQAGQAPLLLRVLIMQRARTMALWGKWLQVWQCTGHKAGAGCISKRLSTSCLFEIHRLT